MGGLGGLDRSHDERFFGYRSAHATISASKGAAQSGGRSVAYGSCQDKAPAASDAPREGVPRMTIAQQIATVLRHTLTHREVALMMGDGSICEYMCRGCEHTGIHQGAHIECECWCHPLRALIPRVVDMEKSLRERADYMLRENEALEKKYQDLEQEYRALARKLQEADGAPGIAPSTGE